MQLTYEPARAEDGPVIFGFAKELIERYETDQDLDLEMALAWTKRKIEKRIDEYTRVLCDGAAAAYYRFAPDGERMELDDLYVLPEYRGRGLGRQVIRCLMDRGRQLGYDTLGVREIYDWNTGSVRCFTSCGFAPVARTDKGWRYEAKL